MSNYLSQMRIQKKLTQAELARELKISNSHYTKIEGGFSKPSFDLIKRLKGFYGSDFDTNEVFK